MMDLYRGALRRPERSIQRLYGLAQRDIWREDDHPWGELSFDDLPDPIREGAAGLLTQVQSTELAPLLCAARMVERMIGLRPGTGGSAGVDYLDQTASRYRIFGDLLKATSFLIKRDALPEIPHPEILGFAIDG